MITDVAHICRAQQSIANGMYQHIGIRMPQQTFLMLQADASQPQFTSFHQAVYIITEAYPYFHCEEIDMINNRI